MAKSHEMEIDIHRLHVEWKEFPKRYHEAAMKAADAVEKADRLKSKMELVWAQVEEEVRESPSAFRLVKVTDSAVEMKVKLDERYQEAQEAFLKAKAEVTYYKALTDSLDANKTAIEYLSKLRLADYFSEPKISGEMREDAVDKTHARIAGKTSKK